MTGLVLIDDDSGQCVPGAVQHEQRIGLSLPLRSAQCAAHAALQAPVPHRSELGVVPDQQRTAARKHPGVHDACAVYALALRRIRDTQP